MGFSEFLQSRREAAVALVRELRKQYEYVSVLGADVKARMIRADQNTTGIRPGEDTDCGFVVKLRSGGVVLEYSLDDLQEDTAALAAQIADSFRLSAALQAKAVEAAPLQDEPLVQSFARPDDLARYTDAELLDFCKAQQRSISAGSEFVRNAIPAEDLLGIIHYNTEVIDADRQGRSPYDFSPKAIEEIRMIKAILDRDE